MFKLNHTKVLAAGALLLATMLLSGCQSWRDIFRPSASPPPPQDEVVVKTLGEASDEIGKSLKVLAELKSKGKQTSTYRPPASGPLAKQISLRWSGPVGPAIQSIAAMIGYSYKSSGREPPAPPLVVVDARNAKAFEVLEDIGWQLPSNVGLVVDDDRAAINVIFTEKGSEP